MECTRCGNEIQRGQITHYEYCGEKRFRVNPRYAKISLKTPEMQSYDKPQSIYLCDSCYEEFCGFLENV